MGFFDFIGKIFKGKKETKYSIADYLEGRYPLYSQFGNDIYASDVVQQAINSIVTEISKLDPLHVRTVRNGEHIPVDGNIQSVLDNPNPLMTTCDFIEKIVWNLLLNYNSFIYPLWEGDKLVGLYPLQPTYVEWQKDKSNNLRVHLKFANNYEVNLPYENIIHIRYRYSVSEFMGGNQNGKPDNKALLETLKLNDTLLKGLAKSLKMQCSVNAVIKMKGMFNDDLKKAEVKAFEDRLRNNESGLLTIDNQSEFIPIQKQISLLDKNTLEFIDKKILRSFGCSIAIIDGDYTPQQYEAFYQKTLEPIIKKLNQAFTKGLFTKREVGFKNKIIFYAKELIFLTNNEKLSLADLLIDSGSAYKNEIRTMFGMKPLAELEGQIAESSNKTNAENNKKDDNTNNDSTDDSTEEDDSGGETDE